MKRSFKLMLALGVSAALVAACGGSDDDPPVVAASDTVVDASAPVVLATQGVPFTFSGGVPEFGTTSTTTVAFTGTGTTPLFKIEADGGSAEGNVQFGSCIFNVVSSTIPSLPAGGSITIVGCQLVLGTAGQNANGVALTADMQLRLNSLLSMVLGGQVTIMPSGEVRLNGQPVGQIQVQQQTGGGS